MAQAQAQEKAKAGAKAGEAKGGQPAPIQNFGIFGLIISCMWK